MGRLPQFSVEEKARIASSVISGELTAREAALRNGTSVSSVYRWRAQLLMSGESGLLGDAPRPRPSQKVKVVTKKEMDVLRRVLEKAENQ
ncbi:helix-turn-helix protein [Streptomyces sp. Amel2xB2]|uniref:helix-turn-helix domain-containing protein n=1 Tax=Streptomyces sp. Amel2xB2 TaxID=1305829 RepID=UPI000DBAB102|nr:helix-turn-helix domain-containing protein [Streptomyces sp. Amel2xB2]RAJ67203.1 helix-turn-helix protein [Streptomyces sp. Amel2xB2]